MVAALSALFIGPPAQSDVKAPSTTKTHSTHRNGVVDEPRYVRIGGIDQWIQISGTNSANPVLLWLNGGPGGSTVRDICLYKSWERAFTIVMWDQRGEGKTFERSGQSVAASMTIDQMTSDGIELAEYLRHHLHQQKILLLGHSGPPPWRDDEAYQTVNRWADTLDPPSNVSSEVCAAERRVPPPAYIQAGAQFSSRLLSEAIGQEDLEAWNTHFALPVFFIQGREDVLTTTSVAKAYVERMRAPSKALIELPGSGHLAIFRDPDAFLAALESRVRPFATDFGR